LEDRGIKYAKGGSTYQGGGEIAKDVLIDAWQNGKRIEFKGEKYLVNKRAGAVQDFSLAKGGEEYVLLENPETKKYFPLGLYAKGGGIGFKGLSSKVAKRYEGKSVPPKYQGEYGKRYSKSEAKEVGDKVAGKVYWQQKGRKFEEGGFIAYADWDYDNKLGTFSSMQKMKDFAMKNKGKYDEIIFEDEYGDNIVVTKDDTAKDLDFLFSEMSKGGGVEKPKYKYYVEWLEDGMLQSEIYNEDEYEEAKELYYQIKYALFDSQYTRPKIFISDYETGEIVFGDEFEYARGGGVSGIDDLIRG